MGEVLIGYSKPFQNDPNFLIAMAHCNYVKENYVPQVQRLTPEKRKQLERAVKEKR